MKKSWLIFVFTLISLYYVTGFFYTDPLLQRQINEEQQFHLPVIQHFSSVNFSQAIEDYGSATFPLYHLIFAGLYNLFNGNLVVLHGINLVLTFLTACLIYFYLNNLNPAFKDFPAVKVLVPILFLLSPYTRITALTLTTDNLPFLFIILFLIAREKFRARQKLYLILTAVACAYLAFYTRQFYIWVVIVCFFSMFEIEQNRVRLGLIVLFNLIMMLPVLYLVWTWGGLVPPSYQELHQVSSNFGFSVPYFFMAILFYLAPYYLYRAADLSKKDSGFSFLKSKAFIATASCMLIYIVYYLLADFHLLDKGGGAAPKLIKFIFGSHASTAFVVISSIGIPVIIDLIGSHLKNNYIWLLLILIFLPTRIFWQKYFDPLILLALFLFTMIADQTEFFKSKYIYLFPVLEIMIFLSSFAYYSS